MDEFLRKFSSEIRIRVTEAGILDELWRERVISYTEKESVKDLSNAENRSKLVDVLIGKDDYVARVFVDAFEKHQKGKPELVSKFRQEIQGSVYTVPIVKPLWFGMTDLDNQFTGRESELDELHRLLTTNREDHEASSALLTSIHGIGGVGKTSLAKKYALLHHRTFYDHVVWINAEDVETMKLQISEIANQIGLRLVDRLVSADLIQNIYLRLGSCNCLFIIDNVVKYEGSGGVKPYLPNTPCKHLPPGVKQPYILLTSRNRKLIKGDDRLLELGMLKLEDSFALVKKTAAEASEAVILQLIERFDGFALGLRQALAYIEDFKDQYEHDDEAIQEYLYKFDDEMAKRQFLDPDPNCTPMIPEESYRHTVYASLKLTLTRLVTNPLCETLLLFMAYLNPENIKASFLHMADLSFGEKTFNKELIMSAISGLHKFSMLQLNKGLIRVHRLVQDVSRIDVDSDIEIRIVKAVLQTLQLVLANGTDMGVQAVLHGTALLRFVEKHKSQLDSFSEFTLNLKYDGDNLKFIRQKLPASSEEDAAKLIWRLSRTTLAIKLAVGYLTVATQASIESYLRKFDSVEVNPADTEVTQILKTSWGITKELIEEDNHGELVLKMLMYIDHMDINHLTPNALCKLMRSSKTDMLAAIKILSRFGLGTFDGERFLVENSLYGYISTIMQNYGVDSQDIVRNIMGVTIGEGHESKLIDHALSVLHGTTIWDVIEGFPGFPLLILQYYRAQGDRRKFEDTKSKFVSLCRGIWVGESDIHITLISKLEFDGEQGNPVELEGAYMMDRNLPVSPKVVHEITEFILGDPVALDKWAQVADSLIDDQLDALRVKRAMKGPDPDYHQAVLMTVQFWISRNGNNATFSRLLGIFRRFNLNRLAREVEDGIIENAW